MLQNLWRHQQENMYVSGHLPLCHLTLSQWDNYSQAFQSPFISQAFLNILNLNFLLSLLLFPWLILLGSRIHIFLLPFIWRCYVVDKSWTSLLLFFPFASRVVQILSPSVHHFSFLIFWGQEAQTAVLKSSSKLCKSSLQKAWNWKAVESRRGFEKNLKVLLHGSWHA